MTGDEIKTLRTVLGWSQERLARELGVSWNSVCRWENGRGIASPLAVRALEQVASQVRVRQAAERGDRPPTTVSAASLSGKE